MADTTSLNTGKKAGVNKRLDDHFSAEVGHDIHTLECMFCVDEIYFDHVVTFVEGMKKGRGTKRSGAGLNYV